MHELAFPVIQRAWGERPHTLSIGLHWSLFFFCFILDFLNSFIQMQTNHSEHVLGSCSWPLLIFVPSLDLSLQVIRQDSYFLVMNRIFMNSSLYLQGLFPSSPLYCLWLRHITIWVLYSIPFTHSWSPASDHLISVAQDPECYSQMFFCRLRLWNKIFGSVHPACREAWDINQ